MGRGGFGTRSDIGFRSGGVLTVPVVETAQGSRNWVRGTGETGSSEKLGLARFAVGESTIRRLGSRARLVTTPSLLGMTLRVWLLTVFCSLCLAKPACESGTVCSEEEVEAWEEKKHGIRYVQMVCVCFFFSSYRLGDLSGFERANTAPMQVFFQISFCMLHGFTLVTTARESLYDNGCLGLFRQIL